MYEKFAKVRRSGLRIFDLTDLSILLKVTVESARVIATRMAKQGIIQRLKRGLYILSEIEINDFEIANRLMKPSYVSLESALNYWGMTTQIPETITSVAGRSKNFNVMGKQFSFSHLPEKLFNFGIQKEASFFIADPEKTLLDMIYYASLGKRSVTFDILDTKKINRSRFFSYAKKYPKRARDLAKEILHEAR